MYITIEPTVKYRSETFGGLAFIPSRAMVVELNKSAYRIINFLAQNGSVIEKTILEQYPGNAQETVRKFIQDLICSSVLKQSESKNENFHKNQIPYGMKPTMRSIPSSQKRYSKFLSAPIFAWWDITKTCNFYCKQCYSESGKASENELTTKEVFSVIEQFAKNKIFYIYFLGGEPLMRKDFFQILDKCQRYGITTMMSTNGWFVNQNIAKQLYEAGVQIVRVSIDGATAKTHDKIRGMQGSFERALQALGTLKKAGIPNVGVSQTLLTDNYLEVDKIIGLALSYDVNEVQVVQLCSTGRGKNLNALNLEQFKKARQLVKQSLESHPKNHITATEGILRKQCERCVSKRVAMPSFIGCPGGRSCMAINEIGNVSPCILYRKYAGSFRKNTLQEIWHSSPLFDSMREIKKGCQDCAYADVCAGECPVATETTSEADRKAFVHNITGQNINSNGCNKHIGGHLCFIRF